MNDARPAVLPSPLLIYVTGPMQGYVDHNYPAFAEASLRLRTAGYNVISPHELGQVPGWEWSDYLRRDLRVLLECSAVAMLDGWERSRGAALETTVAAGLGMPMRTVDGWLDLTAFSEVAAS
jgi:hypothetical protein